MTDAAKHGGARKGSGRPTKSPDGETMRPHQVRMTDAQWAAFQFVGADAMRAWVVRYARKLLNGK